MIVSPSVWSCVRLYGHVRLYGRESVYTVTRPSVRSPVHLYGPVCMVVSPSVLSRVHLYGRESVCVVMSFSVWS